MNEYKDKSLDYIKYQDKIKDILLRKLHNTKKVQTLMDKYMSYVYDMFRDQGEQTVAKNILNGNVPKNYYKENKMNQLKEAKTLQDAENAIRDMFYNPRYKGKVPVKDINFIQKKGNRWDNVYGNKNIIKAIKNFVDDEYIIKQGNMYIWNMYVESMNEQNMLSKRDAKIGTRVKTTMGIRRTGKIVKPFFWKDSTDGTYKSPSKGEVPIEWDNGEKGYHNVKFLTKENKMNEDKFKIGDVVANKRTKWIGTVRSEEDRGEVRTDADGMVYIRNLEKYDPKKHKNYHIAPSMKKELGKKWDKLNEQKLSKLQLAYREFFKAKLAEFGVKSPVEITTDEKRKEFWNSIKKEWPAAKKKIQEGVFRQKIRGYIAEFLDDPNVYVEPIEKGIVKTKTHKKNEDSVAGGKGDKLNPENVDPKELEVGIAVEREHTDSNDVAQEIALDHLAEDSKYYSKLIKSGIVDEKDALDLAKKYGMTEGLQFRKFIRSMIKEELKKYTLEKGSIIKQEGIPVELNQEAEVLATPGNMRIIKKMKTEASIPLPSSWKQVSNNEWRHDKSKFTISVKKELGQYNIVGQVDGWPASSIADGFGNEKDAIKMALNFIKSQYKQGSKGR